MTNDKPVLDLGGGDPLAQSIGENPFAVGLNVMPFFLLWSRTRNWSPFVGGLLM